MTPAFFSLRTHGWERLRDSPLGRLASSGVEAGVLLAEGAQYSAKENRSCEQERDRCMSSRAPPTGCRSGLQMSPAGAQAAEPGAAGQGRPPRWWWDPAAGSQGEASASAREGRLKLELRCMVPEPLQQRGTLPPL